MCPKRGKSLEVFESQALWGTFGTEKRTIRAVEKLHHQEVHNLLGLFIQRCLDKREAYI
jgi:hypothetical protein